MKGKESEKRYFVSSEEAELESWYQQTVTKLYRYVYSKLQNREETEDITQEAYARCLKTYNFKDNLPPYAYLKETARNLMNDRFRQSKKVHSIRILDQVMPDETIAETDVSAQIDIQNLLNTLPPDYRQVLELRIVSGYSRKETAAKMGRSEDAVRGLQYRAIQVLRQLMDRGGRLL